MQLFLRLRVSPTHLSFYQSLQWMKSMTYLFFCLFLLKDQYHKLENIEHFSILSSSTGTASQVSHSSFLTI